MYIKGDWRRGPRGRERRPRSADGLWPRPRLSVERGRRRKFEIRRLRGRRGLLADGAPMRDGGQGVPPGGGRRSKEV